MGAALEVGQHALDLPRRGGVRRRPARGDRDCPGASGAEAERRSRPWARSRCRGRSRRCRQTSSNLASCVAGAARKGDQPRVRRLGANLGRDRRDRRDAPAVEFGRRQHARPGIEDLRRIRAGRELAAKILGRSLDEPVDQAREQVRMAIGEEPRRRLVRRAAAGDHVARDRPGRAAEADQRGFLRQAPLRARSSVSNTGSSRRQSGASAQRREILGVADRIEARALAALER